MFTRARKKVTRKKIIAKLRDGAVIQVEKISFHRLAEMSGPAAKPGHLTFTGRIHIPYGSTYSIDEE